MQCTVTQLQVHVHTHTSKMSPFSEVDEVVWHSRDLVLISIPNEHYPAQVHSCRAKHNHYYVFYPGTARVIIHVGNAMHQISIAGGSCMQN